MMRQDRRKLLTQTEHDVAIGEQRERGHKPLVDYAHLPPMALESNDATGACCLDGLNLSTSP
jgi:hypothetical protein